MKEQFLNKSSMITAPAAWVANGKFVEFDVNARIESVESLYADLKTQMEGSSFKESHYKEIQELLKARSVSLLSNRHWKTAC